MSNWTVYYGDGTTFSSVQGSAASAPPLNVQVITQTTTAEVAREVGANLLHRLDYYWYDEFCGWAGGDLFGLFDYLLRAQGTATVKFGRGIGRTMYQAILDRAIAESKKHAWYPDERR